MEKLKLCLGCMEPLTNNEKVCHICGYKKDTPYNSSYIAPNTTLNNERYTIGKLLNHNGESALYIAYDNVMGCKIQIREYMPNNLCTRNKDTFEIVVNNGCCVQYKSLMAEFTELNRSLVKLRNLGNITPVLDLFNENNTSYAVYEYTDGIKLTEYLKRNMGELSWEETSKLFPPLLTTIGLLHKAGIIHRAISPETIYYTSRKELRLTDFCISAVRTKDTELKAELYKGYSAPEQYTISGKQGTWTDVYGISAVLYKVLTGCMPTEAIVRLNHDNLCSLTDINLEIPESVCNAVMQGMSINIDDRIKNVTDLVTELFENFEKKDSFSSTIKIPRTIVNNSNDEEEDSITDTPTPSTENTLTDEMADEPQSSLFDKIKVPLMIGLLLLGILLILGIFLVNMFSNTEGNYNSLLSHTNDFNSGTTNVVEVTSTQPSVTYMMKNFLGKNIDDVINDEEIKDKLKFEIEKVYSDEYDVNQVVEQSIEAGDKYAEGDTVHVKVSKGPKTAEIPDYKTGSMSCYSKEDYVKLLESKGIPYELIAVVNKGYYSGYVIGIEPSAGEILDIEAGEVLKVTYTDNYDDVPSAETSAYQITTDSTQYEPQEYSSTYSNNNPVYTENATESQYVPPVTDPTVVQTDPPIVQTDPPVVETDPPVVQTDPSVVYTDPVQPDNNNDNDNVPVDNPVEPTPDV